MEEKKVEEWEKEQWLEEFFERRKKEFGDELLEELGFDYLAKVSPEWLWFFGNDVKFGPKITQFPKKTRELIIFACCVAQRNPRGCKVHAHRLLQAGATPKEIMECVFIAGISASHNCVVNILSELKPILESGK